MLSEDAILDAAEVLTLKHRLPFEVVLEVVVFFANFNISRYYICADALIATAIEKKMSPRQLLNVGLMNNLSRIYKN